MSWRKTEIDILNQCSDNDTCPVMLRALIPSDKAGAVIGKGGIVHRQIEDIYNIRLLVSAGRAGPSRMVTMLGEPANVGKAWRESMYRIYDPGHGGVKFGEDLAVNFLVPQPLADALISNELFPRMHSETKVSIVLRRKALINTTECILQLAVPDQSLGCLDGFGVAVEMLAQAFDDYRDLAISPLNVYYNPSDRDGMSPLLPLSPQEDEDPH